jgi:hypothetical protein
VEFILFDAILISKWLMYFFYVFRFQANMDTSIVEITSRKRKRNEEMEEVLEETTFVVVSLVTMLLGVMSWYYDKYFVKEPARNWELERRIFLNRLYRLDELNCCLLWSDG